MLFFDPSMGKRATASLAARVRDMAPFAGLVVSLIFGLLLVDLQQRYASADRVAGSDRVLLESLRETFFHLRDLEAQHRGFLLTTDPSFLQGYQRARRAVEVRLEGLRSHAQGSHDLHPVGTLEEMALRRLEASEEVLREFEAGGTAAAIAALGEGRRTMEAFEGVLADLEDVITLEQAGRNRELERHYRNLLAVVLFGLVGTAGAGVFSGIKLRNYGRAQEASADELRALNEELQGQTEMLLQQREVLESQALELEVQTQELTETTRELAEREEWFRALVEDASELIFVVGRDGTITYASPSTAKLTDVAGMGLRGAPVVKIVHESDRERVNAVLDGLCSGESASERLDVQFVAIDGSVRQLSGNARSLLDQPSVQGIVFNFSDVTQERSVQAQLQQSQKMDAVGQLAGGVAHDFNNLLTAISGYALLAGESLPSDHPARGDINEVLKAADLASSLTRQLLAFSRQQISQPEILDVNDTLQDAAGMLRRLLGTNVTMVTRFDPSIDRVRADASEMRQVLMNLAVNARDAMPDGGQLLMETSNIVLDSEHAERRGVQPGPYVMISVTDTGTGIPPEIQNRIFDPFFTTKEQGKGTGLGLSTTWGIVQRAGGYIWLYSEVDRGTTFKIYLPAARDAGTEPDAPLAVEVAAADAGGVAVLVVEDDEAVRRFAVRILEMDGYRVMEASGGDVALEIMEREPEIRAVVTDVIMPGMSGTALGRQVSERFTGVRVLYTSGYPRDEVMWRGSVPPHVSFLAKPYSSEELRRALRELLMASLAGD